MLRRAKALLRRAEALLRRAEALLRRAEALLRRADCRRSTAAPRPPLEPRRITNRSRTGTACAARSLSS
jgi:hypothetical protein